MLDNLKYFSADYLDNAIKEKLFVLAHQHYLGTYILSLANALTDKKIFNRLEDDLKIILDKLSKDRPIGSNADNSVFDKLIDPNLEFPHQAQSKQIGPWVAQYNEIRSYRPARNAKNIITSIFKAFEPDGFNFNRPELQAEKLITINYDGKEMELFLNKFPFSQNHLLVLIEPKKNQSQFLTKETLNYITEVAIHTTLNANGYFSYNSIGAYASINHLHFHYNLLKNPLPICNLQWTHNGGAIKYPIDIIKTNKLEECWKEIEQLHIKDQAYNLIIDHNVFYIIARCFQETCEHASWINNIAWFELSGIFTVSDKSIYDQMTEKMIYQELKKMRVNP